MHVMTHYCSKHRAYFPIENFKINGSCIPDHCNACLEKDHAQYEATHAGCTAALVDTLRCSISFNDFFSELAAQKEKEHLTHSIVFNSDNPIDIHPSKPGDNAEEVDPTTKNGNKQFKSQADSLAEKLW